VSYLNFSGCYLAAIARDASAKIAHREGVAAVSMFLVSLTGFEDAGARIGIEALGAGWHS